ncbi:MAG TPA: hypothetical protein VFC46_13215 [Humisphaera sp.]|nr:hypothetical protein [Humisphaera sp.]
MGLKSTASIPCGPPENLVLTLRDSCGVRCFIEGGTFRGKTAKWAASHFQQVITIEASQAVYDRLKPEHPLHPNVKFLFGDTRKLLPSIIGELDAPAIFWLDSHWSAGDTFGAGDECPVLQELEIINSSPFEHIILIDDARLFTQPPPPPHDVDSWPTFGDILAVLNRRRPSPYVVIVDDVIIAAPVNRRDAVISYCRATLACDL